VRREPLDGLDGAAGVGWLPKGLPAPTARPWGACQERRRCQSRSRRRRKRRNSHRGRRSRRRPRGRPGAPGRCLQGFRPRTCGPRGSSCCRSLAKDTDFRWEDAPGRAARCSLRLPTMNGQRGRWRASTLRSQHGWPPKGSRLWAGPPVARRRRCGRHLISDFGDHFRKPAVDGAAVKLPRIFGATPVSLFRQQFQRTGDRTGRLDGAELGVVAAQGLTSVARCSRIFDEAGSTPQDHRPAQRWRP
jgi:hypothetical protein